MDPFFTHKPESLSEIKGVEEVPSLKEKVCNGLKASLNYKQKTLWNR